jgi:cytochrome c peroxidase
MKGGFFHDGRFPTLTAVIRHYDKIFKLKLSDQEVSDVSEFLKSI